MVEGKAVVTFGDDTTFILGGSGTFKDDPAVGLNLRSREPGPLTDSELKESEAGAPIVNEFDVILIFKTIKCIDALIGNLEIAKTELNKLLSTEEKNNE